MKTVQVDDIGSLLVIPVKHNFKGLKAMRCHKVTTVMMVNTVGHTIELISTLKMLGAIFWKQIIYLSTIFN